MITTWPLDNTDYTAQAIGAFSGTRTRGVFSADNNLSCTAAGGRQIEISAGLAWFKKSEFWGVAMLNTEKVPLELDIASGTLSRYVAVVARLDKDANKSEITLRYGALSSSPVMPEPIRDIHADEIFLHSILQRAAAVEITPADITDLRTNEAFCGIMRDSVTGIPTAQLQRQADALINQLNEAIKASLSGALPDKSVTTEKFAPDAVAPKAVLSQKADNGCFDFVHTKEVAVHYLEGAGENIKFIAAADFTQGDTFTVNGAAIEAENQNGQPLGTGAIQTNDIVTGVISGGKLKLFCRHVPYLLWSGNATTGTTITVPKLNQFTLIAPKGFALAPISNITNFVEAPVNASMQIISNRNLVKISTTSVKYAVTLLTHLTGGAHEYWRSDLNITELWGM